MTTTLKKSLAAVALLGAVFAFSATTVKADTLSDLTAQLAALQAQIAALTGGSTSCTTFGLPGVMGIQKAVNHMGYAPALTTDGVSGPKTKAGIMWAQAKLGVTADGVWGNISNSAYVAWVASNCGDDDNGDDDNGDDDNGPLSGGAGSITVDDSSEFSGEEVGEGEEDAGVLAFTVEADDESDVEIQSVKVEFDQATTADSEDLSDYADSVSIWLDGEMVGEADVEDFNEVTSTDSWTKSITLDGAVIEAGDEMEFTVAVTASNNLDGSDIDTDAWTADVLQVRFEDGDGVVTTEDTDSDSLEKSFDFASFATATGLELRVELNGDEDATNESRVIEVDDSSDTDDVAILAFTMEADGESDINVSEVPVLLTVTGALNVDDMITGVTLWMGDEQIGSESVGSSVSATETYTFDNLDIDIAENESEEFWVKVDLKSTGDVDLDNGDTISAQLTATQVDAIEAEDGSGEDLEAADLVGTAVGEAHTVYDGAFAFELTSTNDVISQSADPATSGSDTTATFTMVYEITAFDEAAVNIDKTCGEDGSQTADEGVSYIVSDAGNNSSSCSISSTADTATGDSDAWTVAAGQSETFTLTVAVTSSADSFAKVYLESINWESDTTTPDTSPDLFFTSGLGEDDTSTDTVFLNTI